MALSPLAYISPGCSTQCRQCVCAKPDSFAFASVQSISLYRVSTANVSVPTGARADGSPLHAQSQSPPRQEAVTVNDYPLASLFGHGANTSIGAFAYNEEYMACLTPQNKHVLLWRLKDAESLTAKKIPATGLASAFKKEGSPSTMCLAGKHHIVLGTHTGQLISLNTAIDNAEPHSVTIPVSQQQQQRMSASQSAVSLNVSSRQQSLSLGGNFLHSNSSTSATAGQTPAAVESVECVTAATARPDTVACGTSDGTLCILTLNASTGLRVGQSLCPFPPKDKDKDKDKEKLLEVSALPVTTIAFDPTAAQYLAVGSQDGGLALCDVNSQSMVQTFDFGKVPEKHVSSICWIPNEAGAFYTSSADSTVLRKWSVSSKTSVGAVSILSLPSSATTTFAQAGDTTDFTAATLGIRSIACIDQHRVVVGLTDGAVKVYDTTQQKLEAEIVTGHTDAMLSCTIAKHDRDMVATTGVDGAIRLWNLRTMAQQHCIQAGPVMVHSVDWSPNGKHIVAALGSGEVVMYAVATYRESWRTPAFSDLVYRVCWVSADSSLIAATSRAGLVILSSKDGRVVRRYSSPRGAFYGVDIEPSKARAVAVGCHDKHIYVFSLSNAGEQPALVLSGHTDAVCDVSYNPTAPTYLLSGSYDGTLRVWDLSSNDAHTISVTSRALKGHTDRVRSVAWCSLAPYLALSGSADASVRLWDVRNGVAITTVRGHNADIVSLTAHPQRPLIFLSGARDGTIVAWNVALLRQVYLDAALGSLDGSIVADPTSLMGVATSNVTVSHVAGAAVQQLVQELNECASKPAARLQALVNFFDFPNGAAEVAQMASYALDAAGYTAAMQEGKPALSALVLPSSGLIEAARGRATYLNDKAHSKTVTAAGAQYKKQRLLDAAEELLRVGQLESYCEALMEAGEWDRATAAAPAVSRVYWRGVCAKAAAAMEASGDSKAVSYCLIGEQSHRAAQLLTRLSLRQYDAATVVCQTCPQVTEETEQQQQAGAVSQEPPHGTAVDTNGSHTVTQQMQKQRASVLRRFANPQLFAALLISHGLNDDAVAALQQCGDVVLSHLLVHTVPLKEQASIDTAYRLSMLQSIRQHKWDTALLCATRQSNPYDSLATLLAMFQSTQGRQMASKAPTQSFTSGNMNSFHGVSEKLKTFYEQVRGECSRLQLPLDAAAIQQRHASDGLASQNQLAAMVLAADSSSGPVTDSAVLQSLSGFMESLLTVALQDADGSSTPFYLKQAYNVSSYVSLPLDTPAKGQANASVSASASASVPVSCMSAEHKHFLSLVYVVATLMMVKVYRFPGLLNYTFGKARELATGANSASLNTVLANVQGVLSTYSPHSKEVDCAAVGAVLPALSNEGRQMISALTGETICGAVHVLEDGSSFLARSEALMWSLCCHFSPLASGARLTAL